MLLERLRLTFALLPLPPCQGCLVSVLSSKLSKSSCSPKPSKPSDLHASPLPTPPSTLRLRRLRRLRSRLRRRGRDPAPKAGGTYGASSYIRCLICRGGCVSNYTNMVKSCLQCYRNGQFRSGPRQSGLAGRSLPPHAISMASSI